MDVFHHHDRIVHDEADRDDDRHQRQVVQAETEDVHQGETGDQRDTEHRRDNQRRRQLAQEQRHHRDHQQDRDQQGDLDFVQRGANGLRAVDQGFHLHRGRQHRFEAGQGGLNAVDGFNNVGAGLAENHQIHTGAISGPGLHVGIFRTVDDVGDIAQVNRGAILVGNDELAVVLGVEQLVVGRQRGNARLAVQRTFGQVEAGLLNRQPNVGQRQANRREFVRRGLYSDRRALLTGDVDLADAVDLTDLTREQGFHQVAEFGAGHLCRADAENQHRTVGRVDLLPRGQCRHVFGQLAGGRVDRRLYFLGGGVDAFVESELQGQQG